MPAYANHLGSINIALLYVYIWSNGNATVHVTGEGIPVRMVVNFGGRKIWRIGCKVHIGEIKFGESSHSLD